MASEIISCRPENQGIALVTLPQATDFLAELQSSFLPTIPRLRTGMVYGSQSKYLSWKFPEDFVDTLELLQITDMQFGHVECQVDRIMEYRDWVLSKPNRYMLWTGDEFDAAHMMSVGLTWENIAAPDSQIYRFVQLWGPARHRILGYVGGNHEHRSMRMFGDLGMLCAYLLQIPYSDGKQNIDIQFGKHKPFKISLWHGSGAAITKGSIANVLYRFMQQGDSQLYLMGHLHQAMIIPDFREERTANNRIKLVKTIGAIGSSFLNTYGTYAEVKGLRPQDVMMARAVLEANGHWEVTLR